MRFTFHLLANVAIASLASGALAQTSTASQTIPPAPSATGPAASASAPPAALGDIVVTARRREERIQDVPIAITAIGGEDLGRRGVTQMTDLTRAVPGLIVSTGGFGAGVPRFNIRSQIQFEQLITLDPAVGVYFADVVQARAHGLNAGFFDLSSIEVLKGPQGTLFGRNTTGGAVVITPHAATDKLGGYLDGQFGNYGTVNIEGALNLPITDTLDLRVAGRIGKHRGYTPDPFIDKRFDDENSQSWRATLRWRPASNFTNTLVVNGYHANEQGQGWRLTNAIPGSLFAAKPSVIAFLNTVGDKREVGNQYPDNSLYARTIGLSNITTLDLLGVTFKNIFGYRKVDSINNFLDFDGTPSTIYVAPENTHEKQYSDEFQILGKAFDNRLNWIAGAYYFTETGREGQSSLITLTNQNLARTGYVRNESKSLFAQGTYDLGFLQGLSLTGGLRYTWDDRHFQEVGQNLVTGGCSIDATLAAPPACLSPKFKANFSALTYTIGLDWKFAPNKLLYIAHRKGYKAGGFNLRANTAAQFQPFQPEIVKDIELGLKADWDIGGTKLRTNLAGYYQWYTNIQRSVTFVDPLSNILTVSTINAATAHVQGFEAEVSWLPVSNLTISANATHSILRYTSFTQAVAGGGVQDLSANRIAYSPEWTESGSVRYTYPLSGEAGSLALQGDIYHQTSIQLADINVPFGTAAAYTTVNFRLEWNDMLGSRISTAAYLRNAFDKTYYTGGFAIAGLGPVVKQYGAPRTFGLEIRIPFGD